MGSINRNKIRFSIFIFLAVLFLSTPVAAFQDTEGESVMSKDIMEEKLNNGEIDTVRDAVDKALNKSQISKAYRLSSEEIIEDALSGHKANQGNEHRKHQAPGRNRPGA